MSGLPHLGDLPSNSVDDVPAHAGACVVARKDPAVLDAPAAPGDRIVIDLVRLPGARRAGQPMGTFGRGW